MHLEALSLPSLTRADKAYWLSKLFSAYRRNDEPDKAVRTAYELSRLPAKCRYAYDFVVARDLIQEMEQYQAGLDYIEASTQNLASLASFEENRDDEDMMLVNAVALQGMNGPTSPEGQKMLDELVGYYAFSPRVEPFLKVLYESEEALLKVPGADWALAHVAALLWMAIGFGDETRKEELRYVNSVIRRLAKLNRGENGR